MRLIDADALIAFWEEKVTFGECAKWEAQQIIDAIEYAPPRVYVDAVEVVRCDNCKYRYMDADLQVWVCTYGLMIKPNGFCNYGERKTESIDRDELGDCNICKYVGLEHRCNQCVNGSQFYKVEDEPQTEVSAQEYERWLFKEPKDKPQTERRE